MRNSRKVANLRWEKKYNELSAIIGNTGYVPKMKELPNRLAVWLREQKKEYRNGTLRPARKNKLIKLLHISFFEKKINCEKTAVMDTSGREAAWQNKYKKLENFYSKNGYLPNTVDSRQSTEAKELYTWMATQRSSYKRGYLSENHIKQLCELGIFLEGFNGKWQYNYVLVKEYIQETGSPPSQTVIYKNTAIGTWFNKQIYEIRQGKIRPDRAELIMQLGINTTGGKYKREQKWLMFYNAYVEYLEQYGKKPNGREKYKGLNLYKWSYSQVDIIRNGKATEEHTEMLRKIGITADGR